MLRQLVRGHLELVQTRTTHKNRTHSILAKYNHTSPCQKLFSKQGLEWLKTIELTPVDRLLLDANLQTLATLNNQIEQVTKPAGPICRPRKETHESRIAHTRSVHPPLKQLRIPTIAFAHN